MDTIQINSYVTLGNAIYQDFTEKDIKDEPMLFSCDLNSAKKLGGPLTQAFLNNLDPTMKRASDFIVDSRVHMLMKGWYPCIPGYHHDDVFRGRDDNQPYYENIHNVPELQSEHAMLIVGDCSKTQFALGNYEFPIIPRGDIVYKKWHPLVDKLVKDGKLQDYWAEPNRIIYFNWQTWHQGTPATKGGWRFFIRASVKTSRKPVNEVRKQVQVYLEFPMEGW